MHYTYEDTLFNQAAGAIYGQRCRAAHVLRQSRVRDPRTRTHTHTHSRARKTHIQNTCMRACILRTRCLWIIRGHNCHITRRYTRFFPPLCGVCTVARVVVYLEAHATPQVATRRLYSMCILIYVCMYLHEYEHCVPQIEKGRQRAVRLVNVRIIAARQRYRGAQLRVAQRPDHRQQAAQHPHHQRCAHRVHLLDDALRRNENAFGEMHAMISSEFHTSEQSHAFKWNQKCSRMSNLNRK